MTDQNTPPKQVFLSFATEDIRIARELASAIAQDGFSVWWSGDGDLAVGRPWDIAIEDSLKAAKCVLVLWSSASLLSKWVRAEAEEGARRDCLVPLLIDFVTPPLVVRQIQAENLVDWDGDRNDPAYLRLLAAIAKFVSPQASPIKVRTDFRPKNLVVLSDGTGNYAAKRRRTNVWRIYEALDLTRDDQVAFYDDGISTTSFKPFTMLTGVVGYGLERSVLDLYTFICRNYSTADDYVYDPDNPSADDPSKHDKVFAFGFSRGAFTARMLAGLVASEGLIRADSDEEFRRLAKWAYRSYRAKQDRQRHVLNLLRALRNLLLRIRERAPVYDQRKNLNVPVDFLGVFDTVAAYGLPTDEITRAWDKWIWPLAPPDNSLHQSIRSGRHAIAIDDERQAFFPLLWDEDSDSAKQSNEKFKHPVDRIKQVWFAGMHSNVGGGDAHDDLSHIPLCWMASEVVPHGLRFRKAMLRSSRKVPGVWLEHASPLAPMADSRRGGNGYYRYHPRRIDRLCGLDRRASKEDPKSHVKIELPKIHESVFERIRASLGNYAPIGLPEKYVVVTTRAQELTGDADATPPAFAPNPFEHSTQAASRAREQQRAWNEVWKRRVIYFLTVGTTLLLLGLPLLPEQLLPYRMSDTAAAAMGAIGGFLPGFAQGFLDAYHDRPVWFFLVAFVVGAFFWWGSRLKASVNDQIGKVWTSARRNGLQAKQLKDLTPEPTNGIYRLREHPAYRGICRFMSDKLWPTAFGLPIMLAIFVVSIGVIPTLLAYQVASRMESFCGSVPPINVSSTSLQATGVQEFEYYPHKICHATDIKLEEGHRYAIQIAIPVDLTWDPTYATSGSCEPGAGKEPKALLGMWKDASLEVNSTAGVDPTPEMALFLPFRRVWAVNWFVPIAALGDNIPARHYLTDPSTEITATQSERLYFYVNDAAFPLSRTADGGWCMGWDCHYQNNSGGPAKVRVTELKSNASLASLEALKPISCDEQRTLWATWIKK